jgi:hypothetical protein
MSSKHDERPKKQHLETTGHATPSDAQRAAEHKSPTGLPNLEGHAFRSNVEAQNSKQKEVKS